MKERGIIFNGEMVRAILEGRKSQTRRVIKPQPFCPHGEFVNKVSGVFSYSPRYMNLHDCPTQDTFRRYNCPYGVPSDLLWVRETFVLESTQEYPELAKQPTDRPFKIVDGGYEWGKYLLIPHYRATEPEPHIVSYEQDMNDDTTRWKPSIYMPRWASRLTLEITNVRVERVQEISNDDAYKEGAPDVMQNSKYERGDEARVWFAELWQQINEKRGYGWDVNPWVWAIDFKVIGDNNE